MSIFRFFLFSEQLKTGILQINLCIVKCQLDLKQPDPEISDRGKTIKTEQLSSKKGSKKAAFGFNFKTTEEIITNLSYTY